MTDVPASAGLVAIIGIGCRLPGAEDPLSFYRNLAAGRDAVRRGAPRADGTVAAFGALDALEDFDAGFFRFIPRHAALLAPEQRVLLECAWWALEDAGYVPDAVPCSVGVFVASAKTSYHQGPPRNGAEWLVADSAAGQDYAATRISYKLNLHGPSLSIGSASSGSLVAVHMACEALLSGQCDMALAGGAAVTLPQDHYRYDPSLMLAADGYCRPFDAGAGGTVPGNGGAMVALKLLDAAMRDGDQVIAVIRAGAVNNDGGGKVDFYAPSQDGQEAVLREALAMAGLSPADITYVETHGTGTPLGDPIEIAALQSVFGPAGVPSQSVAIGALKSSIGHLHTAGGIAGLVKTALMLRHGMLVPSLHYGSPNPRSVLQDSAFAVCTESRPWPRPAGAPRRAGVSSFGIGGTNAHLVLEEAPPPLDRPVEAPGTWQVVPLSARSPAALDAQRQRLLGFLEAVPHHELRDIAFTLQAGRRHFAHRLALAADSPGSLLAALRGGQVAAPPALAELARAFEASGEPAFASPLHGRRISLPCYPFERQRHWIEQAEAAPVTAAPAHIIPAVAPPEDLLPVLCGVLARCLDRPAEEIGAGLNFSELGVESIVAPLLADELAVATGRQVTPQDFYNHPTPMRLAAALQGRSGTETQPLTLVAVPADALAIIGMAGRFPGAPDLDAFWRVIAEGRSTVGALPAGLWKGAENHIGGMLPDFDAFDAGFFHISPREARLMDPQQRVFLEECWRALDDAGLVAAGLAGKEIGVFAGAQAGDYPREGDTSHGTIGQSLAVLAARVAYALDLRGPALTVDTACSAALAALHLAAQSLRLRECEVALAGGVSIAMPYPQAHGFFADAGLLSAGGACRPFADGADGIVPSDGVGVVVLKRLADALRDGDTLRGIILGSALNQDGSTNGITAPNGPAQAALIAGLYRRAGIEPSSIGLVEAHGTGTRLGDPIELAALEKAFGGAGCAIGSVKANIGHALPAAGIAGLLKVLLAMEAGLVPPSPPHLGQREAVPLGNGSFHAPGRTMPWPMDRRRAAISAFGFGGTNAHLVVEAPPSAAAPAEQADAWPILLSAPDAKVLAQRAALLRDWLEGPGAGHSLGDVAWTLAGGARFTCRAGFIARNHADLLAGLAVLASGGAAVLVDERIAAFLRGGETPSMPRGRRLRLPPYPFARERFWIGGEPAAPPPEAMPAVPAAGTDTGLRDTLRRAVAEALYLAPEAVGDTAPLGDLGLDSILAVEIAKALSDELSVPVRAIDFYEAGTVAKLAAMLAAREPPSAAAPTGKPASEPAAMPVEAPSDAIAIIGLSGRFPGAADLGAFWELLREGRDAITEIPAERWDLDGFFDAKRGAPCRSYSRWGGFLQGIDLFDPLFFHISPREAELIDPQERLFLTCAQAALEDAGWVPERLGAGRVGVFAGLMYSEWQLLAAEASSPERFVPAHAPYWSVANRVSFTFGWQGPSMAVDSACSSSLTALHLACASLRRGECAAALAGGVNLSLHPRKYLGLSAGRFAATDGRCRSFGAGGDGYVPGEGVGVVVLKRLADALADGDTIHAVVRGSALNHGGHASGYAVPSPEAQAGAIRDALADAGVDPASIGYVEAHGTGTALGDPIEIEGLRRGFGGAARELPIGSVKSNIGHLEAAAGVAALAKVVLQLRHATLVPSLHATPPNPELDLPVSGFAVVQDARHWAPQRTETEPLPRRAGISSFGAGGSNAHVVLEEAPVPPHRGPPPAGPWLLPLSAPSSEQLQRWAASLAAHWRLQPDTDWALADLAHTLRVGRGAWSQRAALLVANRQELLDGLDALAKGAAWGGLWHGRTGDTPMPDTELDALHAWLNGADAEAAMGAVPGARRLSLPPTPLAEQRCWLPDAPAPPTTPEGPRRLHWAPSNPVLTEHRLGGRPVVPGAALLLAVAEAIGLEQPVHLSDIVFVASLVGNGLGASAELSISDGPAGRRFLVTSAGQTIMKGRVVAAGAEAPPCGGDQGIPDATGAGFAPDAFYARLEAAGAVYGPSFRRIMGACSDGKSARVTLAPGAPAAGLLDAAWQAVALLAPAQVAHVPFTIATACFHGKAEGAASARLQRRGAAGPITVDAVVEDDAGAVLAHFSGLVLRSMPQPATPDGMVLLVPRWLAEPAPAQPGGGATAVVAGQGDADFLAALREAARSVPLREVPLDTAPGGGGRMASACGDATEIIFLAGLADTEAPLPDTLRLRQAEASGVLPLLALVQAWMSQGPLRERRLKVVTRGVQATSAAEAPRPWQAAAIGLAKVAGLELPRLATATIDLPAEAVAMDLPALAAAVLAEPARDGRVEIALRGGRRLVQRVAPVDLPLPGFNPFRPWGVHVIAGGARGIGLAMACHVARRSHARVLLLGRSPAGSAAAALEAVAQAGGEALYRQADLTDTAALRAAIDEARHRWGPVNGVIHSALVLEDRSLLRLDEASLRAALDPKATGAVALAAAVADEELDYFAFFSSANAVFGNAGQANYVAGCRFKDAFASYLRQARAVPALTIDWGYWGEVGVVSDAALRERLAQQGILPISIDEGADAFERALCAGVAQVMPVAGTASAFARLGVQLAPPSAEAAEELALAALERLAACQVAVALGELGFRPGPPRDVASWAVACGIAPAWQGLFAACLDILGRSQLATQHGDAWAALPLPPADPNARDAALAAAPTLSAHATLLDNALAALPAVLTGRGNGLVALMPGGSSALVEAVYSSATATLRLNAEVADAVRAFVAPMPAGRGVRILEVGGGTGGTTRAVLPVLAALRPDVEYLFTDVSPAFLPVAQQRFGAMLPGFKALRLDIASAGDAGLPDVDVVIAANVLHATPALRHSLEACRRLLRPGGVLVLNETTAARDFATLTFGLTLGWWNAADPAERLPHGPAASAETWRRLLAEAGFTAIRSNPESGTAPQTIFIATAPQSEAVDGTARQALRQHLVQLVGGVLKLRPEAIDPAEQFGIYGLESTMALEVIAALEEAFGELPKALLFEANSIETLAGWLERNHPAEASSFDRPAPRLAGPALVPRFTPQRAQDEAPPEDAIAVVAMAGRYPGAGTPDELWALLRDGRSAIGEVPAGRWDHAAHYDPAAERDDKSHTRFGGFVENIDCFDAPLFHISPAEARAIDPMERQFIEVLWELLENAGHTPERLKLGARNALGGDVGIFVGVMSQTYEQLATELWAKGSYTGAFSSHSSIANRASFLFDFTGPSLAVDTACSSSLSAVHMACEALRRGDCRAAVAGGANLLMHPLHHILLSAYRVLSPDALTRAFGAGGKGFVVGEGIGAVLLRPLADALRDGDPVLGILRGSAVNTCGRTSSYSAPSVTSQTAVIEAALRRARIGPESISYVEAHGTGTELGDPVEVRALTQAWWNASGRQDAPGTRCAIGSVKTNIGHLEAAAGIAGLTKVLLQLRHGMLAPSLHAIPPNPHIDFAAAPFAVQTQLAPWPLLSGPRRAGVSSFGLGGANAHVVLEEAPALSPAAPDDGSPALILVSARTEDRLRVHLQRLAAALREEPGLAVRDVAWTLQVGRQALAERWAVVVHSQAALLAAIEAWLAGREVPGLRRGSLKRLGSSAAAGAVAEAGQASDPVAMAAHWAQGGRILPELLPRTAPPRIVALPNYPFEPRRFWLDDGPGFSRAAISASRAEVRATSAAAAPLEPVADYYDVTLPVRADRLDEAYFSLAPIVAPPPGFSWTRTVLDPAADPAATEALLESQRTLRRVLLDGIDLGPGPARVLDFGCGAGTDLIRLAQAHPALTGLGRTLAPEHARVAGARVALAGLQHRLSIETGDSAAAPFAGLFDLILGIEVAHHVADKDRLFANLVASLASAGRIALADCVAPRVGVAVPETGSWTLAEAEYAATMARAGLRILRAVDCSCEVSACLQDHAIEDVMARLAAGGMPADRLTLVRRVHAGWANFGRALAEGSIRYLLLQMARATEDVATLTRLNGSVLAAALPFADVLAPAPRQDRAILGTLLSCLAGVLGMGAAEIEPEVPFAEQGLDSLGGLRFLDALSQALGSTLDAALLYDHPTPALLAAAVAPLAAPEPQAAPPPAEITAAPNVALPELQGPSPVAIVGLATRLPGASDQQQLWQVLREGRDCVTEIPPDRWDTKRHWSEDREATDRSYGKWGGFLTDHDKFDACFFGIAAREAACADPQQRIFLEAAWHALEDAGLATDALRGARCGIYAGLCGNEYAGLMGRAGVTPDAYAMLGNAGSILAARLAYLLDLKGPALTIDTACSSSLVAVHLAVEALRRGEVDVALAGGVSLYLGEQPFKQMSRAGMLSPTGRCRSFDEAADGIVPAEGVAVVVLKRLDSAIADRDQIHGVILGSGINQDGRTNGLTAPSAAAQAALIGETVDAAGIPADSIDMLEAHGTGTRLGDPIEAAGLVAAFSARTQRRGFCVLGSLKSNLGHTTAAAGVAGLAKVLLSLRHEVIPRSLHLATPNPLMRLERSAFRLASEAQPWPVVPGRPRRAGVSSFGFSGTNAHLLVQEASALPVAAEEAGWRVVTLSARDEAALRRGLSALGDWLEQAGTLRLADIAYTLNHRRRHEAVRAAFVVADLPSLRKALREPVRSLPGVAAAPPAPREVRRDSAEWHRWLHAQAEAYLAGGALDLAALDEGAGVRVVSLPGYAFARDRHWFAETKIASAVRLYVPSWVAAPADGAGAPRHATTLALVNSLAEAAALQALLPGNLHAVLAGTSCNLDATPWVIRPGVPQDLAAVLRRLPAWPDRVADLWALGATSGADPLGQARALFVLAQALAARPEAVRGAVRIVHAHPAEFPSGAAGLVASLPQAVPGLALTTLVLDQAARAGALPLVAAAFGRPVGEMRHHSGRAEMRRPMALTAPAVAAKQVPGTVLVAGGLGGIGKALCRHLAAPGISLAILGRSPLGATGERLLGALRAAGAGAAYWQANVTDAAALNLVLSSVRNAFGPITQVHHLAGVMGSSTLAGKQMAEADAALAAKITGALALDAATAADPVERFVLHGSLAATLGDLGQGDYAMANRFLETFAEWRSSQRRGRSLCIAWPLWDEGGMQPGDAAATLLQGLSGLPPLRTADALAALDTAMELDQPVVLVAAGDLEAALPRSAEAPRATRPGSPATGLLQWLRALAASILREDAAALDPAASLLAHGFDSITLKELASAMSRRLGVEISATMFYRHGSLREIAAHLAAEHPGAFAATAAPPVAHLALAVAEDPVAIIGMAGRFPGAPDLAAFWDLLREGRDAIGPPPAGRPGWQGHVTPAGYIASIEEFDAAFFQIAPNEAALMDPQQRLFLQTAWQALETAGIRPDSLAGSRTGVFVGVQSSDYAEVVRGLAAPQLVTGLAHSAIPNRLSHWLDLRGPSVAIDAACAAGLLAVHQAAAAIRAGDSDLAIAGAVSLLLSPVSGPMVEAMGVLAPDGRCKSFARQANGYGRGEGVASVVLKRLSRALADGDPVLGVIRGSAAGHGGHAASLTAPDPASQAALLLQAWEAAGIDAHDIAHVEAHGTGTELGDPTEVEGLKEALATHAARRGEAALPRGHVGLGSVKSNIGHLEPASGMAGLAKVLLAFRHGTWPATLHCAEPNPLLRLQESPLRLVTAPEPWPGPQAVAGVSAFGFAGAMAHMVLAPPPQQANPPAPSGNRLALPLSARDMPALRRMAAALCAVLERQDAPALDAVARTLRHGRTAFEQRLAVVAATPAEAAGLLRDWLDGAARPGMVYCPPAEVPRRPFRQWLRGRAAARDVGADAEAQARAWASGEDVDWPPPLAGVPVAALPPYPFARPPHWAVATAAVPVPPSGVLGAAEAGPDGTSWPLAFPALLADHRVSGRAMLPAAATAALVRAAAGPATAQFADLLWSRPVALDAPARLRLATYGPDGGAGFEILDAEGAVAVSGTILPGSPPPPAPEPLAAIAARCPELLAGAALYRDFAAAGLDCGPAFRRLHEASLGETEALGRIAPAIGGSGLDPDPTLLDAAAQAGAALLRRAGPGPLQPFTADAIRLYAPLDGAAFVLARQVGADLLDLSVLDNEGAVLAAVEGFCARAPAPLAPLSVWAPDWEAMPDAAPPGICPDAPVLVLRQMADRGLTAALRDLHPGLAEISLGHVTRRLGALAWEAAPAELERALSMAEAEAGSFRRIYALNTLAGQDGFDPSSLPAMQQLGLAPLFRLGRFLARPARGDASLVAVTERTEAADPSGGGVAAFCLSLGQEWPAGRVVAVDIGAGPHDPAALARLLAAETGEPGQPAARLWQDGRRKARVLRPVALPPAAEMVSGLYLLVGGAGGIGAALARHLARPGMHLVLTGRRAADARIEGLLGDLRGLGAEAEYVAADAADAPAMLALVARLRRQHGPIAGVVHAALVLANAPLAGMTDAAFAEALAPKLAGSLWLAEAFAEEPPGFLALFSSVIALSGGGGQANYAAAAGFQDAFGHWLASRLRCPVRILDWGFWSDTGSVAQPAERARLARLGMGGIATAEGLSVFAQALAAPHPRLAIARMLPAGRGTAAVAAPVAVGTATTSAAVERSQVLAWLRGLVGEIIGRDADGLPEAEPLVLLGVDSLVNMQVQRRLEAALGRLSKTLLFEHGDLGLLTDALIASHGAALARLLGVAVPPPVPMRAAALAPAVVTEEDAIAIIGMACRFPGADTPEAFWSMIREGRDAFGPVPADRWPAGATERGAFLHGVDLFDALHFGISFREAAAMDPQERLFLQAAWHALEDAGHTRAGLRAASLAGTGADVGVYVGVMNGAFQLHAARPGAGGAPVQAIAPYWSIANRVSWLFDFHGPSMAVDTACSSSAAALHLACEALRRGEIGAALAGGVSLLLHPRQFETMHAMRMISPSGQCRPFAEGADGFVPGEGLAAVVLRPLGAAVAGGDRILGVIRGSAMNTGGRTSGYTVPSPAAQAEVVASAVARAGVDPASIGYVEAHGTGTALGDPIELEGLGRALGQGDALPPCAVGSVKALVGHLESAAGVAGLARILLQFRKGEIAPAPLRGALNPALPMDGSRFVLPDAPTPWSGSRRAGLSSFGAGGVNVHVVLEAPPPPAPPPPARPRIVPLSARTPAQLRQLANRLEAALADSEVNLTAIAWTLQTGREAMTHRFACVADDLPGLRVALREFVAGPEAAAPLPADHATATFENLRGMDLPALAALWAGGTNLPWEAIWDGPTPQRIGLPNYPFAPERHWPAGLVPEPSDLHPLIERALPSPQSAAFTLRLDATAPLLAGHLVDGAALLPGTAVLELVRGAVALATGEAISALADIAWLAPIPAGAEIVLDLRDDAAGRRFELTSTSGGRRKLHASGLVPAAQDGSPPPARDAGALEAALPQRLEGDAIYARLAQLGVAYGEPFQGLARIAFDADTALARLRPVVPMPDMPWQPALLDAAFQATMGLLGAAGQIEPLVPFLAESARVLMPLDGAASVLVRRAPPGGAGGVVVDIELLGAQGQVLASFGGVTLRARAAPVLAASPLDRLDRLAASRTLAHWQAHGVFAAPAQCCTPAEIARVLRLQDRHTRLLAAALDLFGQRGWLQRDGEAWCALPAAEEAGRGGLAAQVALAAAEPTLAPHLELLDRCMASLQGILDGSIPASEAFFPGGSMELLARVYAGDDNAAFLHAAAAQAVVKAVREAGATPRVLEIGGGTGSTTGPVLRALRQAGLSAEFVFTDLSPRFVQQAQQTFGAEDAGFRAALLDISRDPTAQGMDGGFDVVLAANVLHATPDMRETLRHTAALLAPGGTLVVNEMTAARDYATLTFGLLEGWWLAKDAESRLRHAPLLSTAQWRRLLAETGFEVATITLPPVVTDEAATPQAVLVARNAGAAAPKATPAAMPHGGIRGIEDAVTEEVAAVFEMPVEMVRAGGVLSFAELGGDSLLSAELATRLGQRLGVPLKTTAIFNYPNIALLAAHIAEEFPGAGAPMKATPPAMPVAEDEASALQDVLRALEIGDIDVDEALRRVTPVL